MPAFLSELLSQMRGIWSRLDGGQRLTIGSVVLAALVGLSAIVWFAGQPDYETIMTTEDPAVLNDAVKALGSAGIGFRDDASRIEVERSQVGRAMAALNRAGLVGEADPERADSMTSVTQDSMSRRDGLQAKRNRRAEKAVQLIDGVIRAYVTSSKPKRSVYTSLDSQNQPSASVTLTLKRGESFLPIARAAISQVSSTVGVPEEFVTAINARTKQTYSLDPDGTSVDGSDFLQQQRKRSQELTQLAQAWLDRLYEGKAIVTVTLDLDPTFTSSEEKIQPNAPIIVTDDKTEDTTTGSGGAGRVATGDPSVSDASASGGGSSGPTQKSKTSKRTYEPFVGVRRSGMLTPDVRRMTIALVLDDSIDSSKVPGIEDAIKTTVGFQQTRPGGRSDEFKTLVEKFPEMPEIEVGGGLDVMEMVREFGPLAGQVLGVVLVLLFLKRLLSTAKTTSVSSRPETSKTVHGENPDEPTVVLTPDERRRKLRRDIEKSIADDPAAMTRLLEGWLAEQKT